MLSRMELDEEYNDRIERVRHDEFPALKGITYLDHAGSTLVARSQLDAHHRDILTNLYGNPHSHCPSSQLSTDTVDLVRVRVLQFFNTTPDEYSIIFTSGCTGALKLVAESFDYHGNHDHGDGKVKERKGKFCYLVDNHTSVQGMREMAFVRAGAVSCVDPDVEGQLQSKHSEHILFRHQNFAKGGNCLFAFPSQSNFSGRKYPLDWVAMARKGLLGFQGTGEGSWFTMLDAAGQVGTSPLDLRAHKPDFVSISFYKIFGFPTGLGALLVHQSAAHTLRKTYFGGGTVSVSLATERYHVNRPGLSDRFEDGTISFLDVIALRHGFDSLQAITGGMKQTQHHTFTLARYFHHQLSSLRHGNGNPVAQIYCNGDFSNPDCQGPVINFNLLRESGDYVGFAEVDKLAQLYDIHVRTGCFCNIGACQTFLGLSSQQIRDNFDAGHVCGDQRDLIHGKPTGSVRVSLGYMSTLQDVCQCLQFIVDCFLDNVPEKPVFYTAEGHTKVVSGNTESKKHNSASSKPEDKDTTHRHPVHGQSEGNPNVSAVSQGEGIPNVSAVSQAEGIPNVSAVSQVEGIPNVSAVSQGEGIPNVSAVSQAEGIPNVSAVSQAEDIPNVSAVSQAEGIPNVSAVSQAEGIPNVSAVSQAEDIPNVSAVSQAEGIPNVSAVSQVEGIPNVSSVSQVEGIPNVSAVNQSDHCHKSPDQEGTTIVAPTSEEKIGEEQPRRDVCIESSISHSTSVKHHRSPRQPQGKTYLSAIFLYPVKSCAAFQVETWPVSARGLLYDRQWMIVTDSGIALSQKRETTLCLLQPEIDLDEKSLVLNFPGMPSISVPITDKNQSGSAALQTGLCTSKVCGDRVASLDCGQEVSDWLSATLKKPGCRLVQQKSDDTRKSKLKKSTEGERISLANESQYLLINRATVSALRQQMEERQRNELYHAATCSIPDVENLVHRFRSNLVIAGGSEFEEELCQSVQIGDCHFKSQGPCTRCQMVCVDQATGERSKEPLQTLAVWRGRKILFGIHLCHSEQLVSGELKVGDSVTMFPE